VLKLNKNPLFQPTSSAVDLAKLAAPQTLRRHRRDRKREIRDARRMTSAVEAIAGLDRDGEIFGFTKGQFSLLQLIQAAVAVTGPAHLSLSTWTAGENDVEALTVMRDRGDLLGLRLLIDFSMARREPAQTNQMREKLGRDNIRVTQTHAKFVLLQNAAWRAVIQTSMNLNTNPRNENFTIAHDPEMATFLNAILDEVWAKQKADTIVDERPYDIIKHWQTDL
jgi:hypothetical protein